jgi:hypothetical protein
MRQHQLVISSCFPERSEAAHADGRIEWSGAPPEPDERREASRAGDVDCSVSGIFG